MGERRRRTGVVLQARAGKRSPTAALRVAVDLATAGTITTDEALGRITADQARSHLEAAATTGGRTLASGTGAGPGVATGLVVTDPDGQERAQLMTCLNPGLNHWAGPLVADREGWWSYRVEGWSDPYGTWVHDAEIKVAAGVDVELMLAEGALVLERARDEV